MKAVHVIKQLPAVLLWQTTGESPPQDDIEIPIIGSHFVVKLLSYGVGAGSWVKMAITKHIYLMMVITLFTLIEEMTQTPRETIKHPMYLTRRLMRDIKDATISP